MATVIKRHSWGVCFAFGTIGIIHHYGWFTRNLMSYDGFKILGRISYSAFVCHVFLLKIFMVSAHHMVEFSLKNTVNFFFWRLSVEFYLSYLIAVHDCNCYLRIQQYDGIAFVDMHRNSYFIGTKDANCKE